MDWTKWKTFADNELNNVAEIKKQEKMVFTDSDKPR